MCSIIVQKTVFLQHQRWYTFRLLFTVIEPDTTISVPSHVINDYTVYSNGLQLTIRGAEGHALQLFDMTGRLLLTRRSADGTYQIPSPGIYILRVDGYRPRKVAVVK